MLAGVDGVDDIGVDLYKSTLTLSDIVRCNRLRATSLMVWRCVADLKPVVFDVHFAAAGLDLDPAPPAGH
jgi:hypothetical protein